LIDSQNIFVEVYHREKSRCILYRYELQEEVEIESLGVRFLVSDAYKRTSLSRKATREL